MLAVGGGNRDRVARCNFFDRYRVVKRVHIGKGNGNISAGGIDQDKLIVPVNIIGAGNGPDGAQNGGAFVIVNRYAGIGAAIVRIACCKTLAYKYHRHRQPRGCRRPGPAW
jgi:hypothetical protein